MAGAVNNGLTQALGVGTAGLIAGTATAGIAQAAGVGLAGGAVTNLAVTVIGVAGVGQTGAPQPAFDASVILVGAAGIGGAGIVRAVVENAALVGGGNGGKKKRKQILRIARKEIVKRKPKIAAIAPIVAADEPPVVDYRLDALNSARLLLLGVIKAVEPKPELEPEEAEFVVEPIESEPESDDDDEAVADLIEQEMQAERAVRETVTAMLADILGQINSDPDIEAARDDEEAMTALLTQQLEDQQNISDVVRDVLVEEANSIREDMEQA